MRGDFFESFVADILKPMRLAVAHRLRVTGMEIDLLARGLDQPRTVLVECKAHRDALPSDVISKLLGNVTIRGADAGWLFTTADLTKDGRGQVTEIESNPKLASIFTWYSPSRLIDVLLSQSAIVDPKTLIGHADPWAVGDATLICTPTGRRWLLELLEAGLPTYCVVCDAFNGRLLPEDDARKTMLLAERFSSLRLHTQSAKAPSQPPAAPMHAPVARVIAGDAWDDLRPARPIDFVGRDDTIRDILDFLEKVRSGGTTTRTFSIQGPSGWGKSSLVLKLGDIAKRRRQLRKCSVTAIDSRSATNSAFVSSAIRQSLLDAKAIGLLPDDQECNIQSLNHPLDSGDVISAMQRLNESDSLIVVIFDQFEELFAKESLFDTFNAVRELSLDLDGKQSRIVLGFAWKTDISLPQQHPAYHLWHQLADRRRDFRIRPFGSGDISRVISRAEKPAGVAFSPALRGRLLDQCQGYPWLLKKLLVHIFRRLKTTPSQYLLLERELDVEILFKDDLADVTADQLRCLKYVAERAPVYVTEVEEHFGGTTTNVLLARRLLVRSGLNYVVYWDIFRDYLVNGKVPQIPWTRNFQRDPRSAVQALQFLSQNSPSASAQLAKHLKTTERSCTNLMSDMVALQLVDRVAEDSYTVASHLSAVSPMTVADHLQRQFARHAVCRELARIDRDAPFPPEVIEDILRKLAATGPRLSETVIHQYAMALRRWLLFSGHIEHKGKYLSRPTGRGSSMGLLTNRRTRRMLFLGCSTPDALLRLVGLLATNADGVPEVQILTDGARNPLYDAIALDLATRSEDKRIYSVHGTADTPVLTRQVATSILAAETVKIVASVLTANSRIANSDLGSELSARLNATWKSSSAVRYANGIRGFYTWACTHAEK